MKNFTDKDVQKSIDMAVEAHSGQVRPNSEIPYVMHSIQVGNLVHHTGELQGETLLKAVIVSNLHDVIGNTHLRYEDIENKFGIEIADAVDSLSMNIHLSQQELPLQVEEFILSTKKIANQPNWVKVIKVVDVISNIIKLSDKFTLCEVEEY